MRFGVGVAYYGTMHPQHAHSARELLKAGVPIVEMRGCAYPEIARAEIVRQALEFRPDVVLFVDNDVVFSVDDARRVSELAHELGTVVTASATRPKSGPVRRVLGGRHSPEVGWLDLTAAPWRPELMSDMAFTAVPLNVLTKLVESSDGYYTNSGVISTGFSNAAPLFSPWRRVRDSLEVVPIERGIYCNPDRAFLLRVQRAGFQIASDPSVNVTSLSAPSYSVRVVPGDAQQRAAHDIATNYAVCVPCFGALDTDQQALLWELQKAGVAIVELHGCPYIDLARSELSRIALNELGCDGVFFLDHDIIFRPRDLLDLCAEANEKQDVVAAVYCMRKTAHSLIGAPDATVGSDVDFFDIGQTYPALYSGLGFAAVPRAVFDALSDFPLLDAGMPGFVRPLFSLDTNGTFYCGEDVSFCSRVQGLTVKHIAGERTEGTPNGVDWEIKRTAHAPTRHRVWLNTRVRIFHRGSYDYGIEDHSIAVPRVAELRAKHVATRAEMRAYFRSAEDFAAAVRARTQGIDDGAEAPHAVLE